MLLIVAVSSHAELHGMHCRAPLGVVSSCQPPTAPAGGHDATHSKMDPPSPTRVVVLTVLKKFAQSGSDVTAEISHPVEPPRVQCEPIAHSLSHGMQVRAIASGSKYLKRQQESKARQRSRHRPRTCQHGSWYIQT